MSHGVLKVMLKLPWLPSPPTLRRFSCPAAGAIFPRLILSWQAVVASKVCFRKAEKFQEDRSGSSFQGVLTLTSESRARMWKQC